MSRSSPMTLFVAFLAAGWASAQEGIVYPEARRSDHVDEYHGTKVPDPYRWLEDPDSPETRKWIEAENALSSSFLEAIPQRKAILDRLTKLWNYERYGVPSRKGGRYFFTKNDGLQNQGVLYTMESLAGEPRVLLDPNRLSEDGTIALKGTSVSEDGNHLAYGLSSGGSDWEEWRVRDVRTGEDLADHLRWIKFSGASWTHDGKGFYYGRYDEPAAGQELEAVNYFQKLYYHRVGTPQSEDRLVYERPDQKEWGFGATVSEDGRYLVIGVWRSSLDKSKVFYQDLQTPDSPIQELLGDFEASYEFVGNDGPVFWFVTDRDAPRSRLIAVDTRDPAPGNWKEILPQFNDTLQSVSWVGGQFFATYLHDACTTVIAVDKNGALVREIGFPALGSAWGFQGDGADTETFYTFSSFAYPATIFRYDVATGKSEVFKKPAVDFDPDQFVTSQVWYQSKDGTKVPMFLCHKKGVGTDGTNPTYLYGYGGFAIEMGPWFSVSVLVWMEQGGVYAMPCLRGGGEFGEDWHQAGMRHSKQRVFEDFVAAAEWLVASNYTSPSRLAIGGGSNGGLLVGACMTQRPDLFGAALPDVGVMDMLRFHKFTIGWAWVDEYGSSDDPEDFEVLHAYSPLHNLQPGTKYPATLITTGDHDDRVVPAHSFKFAATLQAAQAGPAPVLIRIETKAGHGAGKPTAKLIEEAADRWAFLIRVLGVPGPRPPRRLGG